MCVCVIELFLFSIRRRKRGKMMFIVECDFRESTNSSSRLFV
jgi:hypothetical protein